MFRLIPATLAIASMLSACGGDTPTEANTLAGSYRATTFRVTPSGQAAIDVLAQSVADQAAGSARFTITLARQ